MRASRVWCDNEEDTKEFAVWISKFTCARQSITREARPADGRKGPPLRAAWRRHPAPDRASPSNRPPRRFLPWLFRSSCCRMDNALEVPPGLVSMSRYFEVALWKVPYAGCTRIAGLIKGTARGERRRLVTFRSSQRQSRCVCDHGAPAWIPAHVPIVVCQRSAGDLQQHEPLKTVSLPVLPISLRVTRYIRMLYYLAKEKAAGQRRRWTAHIR